MGMVRTMRPRFTFVLMQGLYVSAVKDNRVFTENRVTAMVPCAGKIQGHPQTESFSKVKAL